MNTNRIEIMRSIDTPTRWFLGALSVVLLAMWLPFIPDWQTFIHMWRVETAASLLLVFAMMWLLIRQSQQETRLELKPDEWKLVVLPIVAFILWSGLSAIWAQSWKSAVHHSLIWIEYLIFYLIFRQMLERGRNYSALLGVLVFTLILYALPAIVEFCAYLVFGGTTTLGVRFAKYGEQIVTVLPLVLLGVIRMRGKQFALGALGVTLLWLLIFCSMGRANYVLFACVVLIMFIAVAALRRYRRYVPRFAALIVIFAVAPILIHLFSLFSPSANGSAFTRFTKTEALASSNNFRKLMISVSGTMVRENPVLGVGADNFGLQVNKYRQAYGAANPGDTNLANAEDQIPSHAHNEFLQIAAELGLVGVAIFGWLLIGMGVYAFRSLRSLQTRTSLYPTAAVLGLGMFLASSLVSAYSFRVMQNGIVFFFVLAVATKTGSRLRRGAETADPVSFSSTQLRLAFAAGIVACLGLFTYSAVRLSSAVITSRANRIESTAEATPLYELAMWLDDENPNARHNFGMRLFRRKRFTEAIPHLESAVGLGRGPVAELSYLATAKSLSGDTSGAEATMKTAVEMYPRSPFVLTRYAVLLEANGKVEEAEIIFETAARIDERAAASWKAIMHSGPKALSELAATDPSYLSVTELRPESSLFAVVTERYIRFPEEQRFSLGKVTIDEE